MSDNVFSRSALKALKTPGKPFIHHVNRRGLRPVGMLCVSLMRSRSFEACSGGLKKEMVEPDGIEPTTSCLQSTRSTN